jgi:hypothetical protein
VISKHMTWLVLGAALLFMALPVRADEIIYTDQATFLAALGSSFTDNYTNPNYHPLQTDAYMNSVEGQTQYMTTGFSDNDIVASGTFYCGGCNGSFILFFTNTSFGTANGVFGVGFSVVSNSGFTASVTFGDGSTEDIALPGAGSYFGITDTSLIKNICFGHPNCTATIDDVFSEDHLTIGTAATVAPEPATLSLMGSGLIGLAALFRRKLAGPN